MFRRNVHIIYVFLDVFGYLGAPSARNAVSLEIFVVDKRFVSLRDGVIVFFVGGKVMHFFGNDGGNGPVVVDGVYNLSVRRFYKAEFVYLRVGGKRSYKSYVLTFGGFYRAHSAVMRVVYVADVESSPVSVDTARPQRRKFTLVRKFRYRVGLIHKLRKLRRTEEFLYRGTHGAHVYKPLRRNFLGILRLHAFLYNSFQTGNTYTELVLQKFAHRTYAAVAQVVYVVHRVKSEVKVEIDGNRRHHVVHRNVLVVEFVHKRADVFLFFGGKAVFRVVF